MGFFKECPLSHGGNDLSRAILAEDQQPHQSITGHKEGQETLKKETAPLKGQLAQLCKPISGFKSERYVTEVAVDQLSLFSDGDAIEVMEAPPKETITYTREKKKRQGRNALPYPMI